PLSALSYTAPAPNVIYPLSLHDALPICCSLRTHTVRLHPNGVGPEEERAPAIVERVQVQKDVVFVPDVVPVCTRCANRLRLTVVRPHPEVDGIWRIPHQHLRSLLGRPAVNRLRLPEVRKYGGTRPHGLIQHAVHHNGCLDSWNLHRRRRQDGLRLE